MGAGGGKCYTYNFFTQQWKPSFYPGLCITIFLLIQPVPYAASLAHFEAVQELFSIY